MSTILQVLVVLMGFTGVSVIVWACWKIEPDYVPGARGILHRLIGPLRVGGLPRAMIATCLVVAGTAVGLITTSWALIAWGAPHAPWWTRAAAFACGIVALIPAARWSAEVRRTMRRGTAVMRATRP